MGLSIPLYVCVLSKNYPIFFLVFLFCFIFIIYFIWPGGCVGAQFCGSFCTDSTLFNVNSLFIFGGRAQRRASVFLYIPIIIIAPLLKRTRSHCIRLKYSTFPYLCTLCMGIWLGLPPRTPSNCSFICRE